MPNKWPDLERACRQLGALVRRDQALPRQQTPESLWLNQTSQRLSRQTIPATTCSAPQNHSGAPMIDNPHLVAASDTAAAAGKSWRGSGTRPGVNPGTSGHRTALVARPCLSSSRCTQEAHAERREEWIQSGTKRHDCMERDHYSFINVARLLTVPRSRHWAGPWEEPVTSTAALPSSSEHQQQRSVLGRAPPGVV